MAVVVVVAVAVTVDPPTEEVVLVDEPTTVVPPPPPEPQPGVDRPVRTLVVGDDGAGLLVPGLTTWADSDGRLEVRDGTGVGCGPAMRTAQVEGREVETCGAWIDAWTPVLDEYDPDVVLLSAAAWDVDELLVAGGRDPDTLTESGTDTWLRRRLAGAVDLLASRGAEVVYLPFPHPQSVVGQTETALTVFYLLEFLNDVAVSNDHAHLLAPDQLATYPVPWGDPTGFAPTSETLAWSDQVAAVVGPVLVDEGARNVRQRGGPRVMIVGDSLAWSMGVGLQEWGQTSGAATVFNAGTYGCGVARGGQVTTAYGELTQMAMCDGWAERWQTQLEDFEPDVVVLLTGLWDLTDRRLPDWDEPRSMGDEIFDQYVLDEYREAIDVLSVDPEVEVVWLMTPCYRESDTFGLLSGTDAFGQERLDHLNEVIVPQLLDERPDVDTVDPRERLCPGGSFVEDVGGFAGGRPDGIHLSRDAGLWLAEWLGPELVARIEP
jgi:hypothetical protein